MALIFVVVFAFFYFCVMIELPHFVMPQINVFFNMKIFKTYLGILLLSLVFTSCTNDNDDNQVILVKQIVETSVDGSSMTTTITYDGRKIVSTDNSLKRTIFSYTGSLITKVEELDKVTNQSNTLFFTYANADLVKVSSSDNYIVNYTYNADGTVSYERWTKDANNNDVRLHHGILYFESSKIAKNVCILDTTASNILNTKTITYTYDAKNNAFKNCIGFAAMLNYGSLIAVNNVISSTESSEIENLDTKQITSSIKGYSNELKYNSYGYPIEIVGEKSFFGDSNLNHVKTELYY